MKEKSNLVEVGVKFLENLQSRYEVKVKTICRDNAGENVKLKEKLNELQYGIDFEITAAGTPQHNGVVERAFETLYGRIRATLKLKKIAFRQLPHNWIN